MRGSYLESEIQKRNSLLEIVWMGYERDVQLDILREMMKVRLTAQWKGVRKLGTLRVWLFLGF